MLANYWSFIVDYEAQLKHYTTEVTLLPFNDGVVEEDVSTLSTADYADYNAFVNAEAGKWKEVEDDIRRKRMSILSCLVAFNVTSFPFILQKFGVLEQIQWNLSTLNTHRK